MSLLWTISSWFDVDDVDKQKWSKEKVDIQSETQLGNAWQICPFSFSASPPRKSSLFPHSSIFIHKKDRRVGRVRFVSVRENRPGCGLSVKYKYPPSPSKSVVDDNHHTNLFSPFKFAQLSFFASTFKPLNPQIQSQTTATMAVSTFSSVLRFLYNSTRHHHLSGRHFYFWDLFYLFRGFDPSWNNGLSLSCFACVCGVAFAGRLAIQPHLITLLGDGG